MVAPAARGTPDSSETQGLAAAKGRTGPWRDEVLARSRSPARIWGSALVMPLSAIARFPGSAVLFRTQIDRVTEPPGTIIEPPTN